MIEFDPADFFKNPKTVRQRQYDALRAYYLEGMTQKEAAERFGYTIASFQSLVRDFKKERIIFFPLPRKGPKERRTPKTVAEKIVAWRKKNRSIYDIHDILKGEGLPVSLQTIDRILREEGFSKLPRRVSRERNKTKKNGLIPEKARRLDFDQLDEGSFDCQVGGIYYFIPYMLQTGIHELIEGSAFPETGQLSSLNSVLSILALKLMGQERLSHINNFSFDQGFGLFAGLNVLPKATAISTYSYGMDGRATTAFMKDFVSAIDSLDGDYYDGKTINLDFHTIPHFGEDPPLDENWVGTRGKRMKGALTFFAQDGESKMLSYANADIRRSEASEEILRFVDYWIGVKGVLDQTLVFDSKLTTYGALSQLDRDGVRFLTLRRRGEKLIENVLSMSEDEWVTVKLDIPKRKYNRFKAYEHRIRLPRCNLEVNEIVITEHGRLEPTFVVTNNFEITMPTAVTWYARRWRIDNKISELVDFFGLNALSSPIMIRIHFDVLMTMVADTLYKLLSQDLKGFEECTSEGLFAKFINTPSKVVVEGDVVTVKMKKRAHTPILMANDIFQESWEVPWWGDKILKYEWIS